MFYFIYSGSYDVINDALAILVFIYTVCASEFDPGTSTVSTETQILRGLVVTGIEASLEFKFKKVIESKARRCNKKLQADGQSFDV